MSEPTISITLCPDVPRIYRDIPTQRTVEIALRAPIQSKTKEREALNLALVIDRSGSMSGEKLDYAKRAALFVLDLLDEKDRMAIVAFDGEVFTITPCLNMTQSVRARMKSDIAEIFIGGSTNLSGGWLRGCQLIGEVIAQDHINRCLLLTDGEANIGIVDEAELAMHSRELLVRGVSTSTFGIGVDYNERLLEAMSKHGGGRYHYIQNIEQIPGIFAEELDSLLTMTAREVVLTIDIPKGVSVELMGDWKHQQVEQQLRIFVNDLASEQTRAVYLKVLTPLQADEDKIEFKVTVSAHGEDDISLTATSSVQFVYSDTKDVNSAAVDRAMMERAMQVMLALEAEKALRLELEGRNMAGADTLRSALLEAAPFVNYEISAEYTDMSQRIARGMDPLDRKASHSRNYNRRETRNEMQDTERAALYEKLQKAKNNPPKSGPK